MPSSERSFRPDVNTTQFTDALLGGTQGGYFADSQNGWKTTISNYNPTNDWTRVFMYSDRIIPVLYSNLMKLNGISEDPIVLSIAKIAKVCAMNRVTDAYGRFPTRKSESAVRFRFPTTRRPTFTGRCSTSWTKRSRC